MEISARTRLYGVVGDPVRHSLSPLIHNLWMSEDGRDSVYLAFPLTGEDVEQGLRQMLEMGLQGLNVTLPHKAAAFAAARQAGEEAQALGVANTLSLAEGGGWRADNTDAEGFEVCLRSLPGSGEYSGGEALLIGAGGAARAAAYCLERAGYEVTIANRTLERAQALAAALVPGARTCSLEALPKYLQEADLVVHATSLGHEDGGAGLVFPERDGAIFMDLSYGQASASLVRRASERGWRTMDGLEMLVAQAAASYRIWFGREPDRGEALELCRGMV